MQLEKQKLFCRCERCCLWNMPWLTAFRLLRSCLHQRVCNKLCTTLGLADLHQVHGMLWLLTACGPVQCLLLMHEAQGVMLGQQKGCAMLPFCKC